MDDVGLSLTQRASARAQAIGRRLVTAMPVLLAALSKIGIAAMLWVGGHILLVGAHELGWDAPHDIVHDPEGLVEDAGAAGGRLPGPDNTKQEQRTVGIECRRDGRAGW